MSSAGHLSELDLLRGQVADLSRQLVERDRSMQDLREQSQRLRTIAEGTASETGDEFFASLVTRLTSTLHMQYAVISEVLEVPFRKIRTLAVSAGDTLIDNFEYELAHTPCAIALTQTFTCFDRDLQATFPQFQRLADLGAESYCAVPLWTKSGAVIGLLVVMDTKPLEHSDDLQSLLGVFAPRIAAEFERRRAEQEHAEALADLHNVMEMAPDIMFTLDTQGNMVRWNQRVKDVTGYSQEELLNKPALAFVPTEEQARTAAAIQRAFTDGYAELEGHLLTKDHRIIPYHWTGALLKSSHGEPIGITGIGRDVSDKKRAEEALHKSEQRFALAVEGSNDILWDAHRLPGEPWYAPQTPIWWSPRVRKLLGLQESDSFETFGQWAARLHPDDKDRVFGQLAAHIEHRVPYDVEYRLRTNAGDHRWIRGRGQALWDETGEPRRMSGSCQDITERKWTEEALRKSQERYAQATAAGKVGVWELDVVAGTYHGDSNLKKLFGYVGDELSTDPYVWLNLVHPADQSIAMDHWQRIVNGERDNYNYEVRMLKKDGTVIWTEVRGHAVRDHEGQVTHLFGATVDISERKQTQVALAHSERQLRTVLDALPVGVWFTDRAGKPLLANPAAKQIWSNIKQIGLQTENNQTGWWETIGPANEPHRWALSQVLTTGVHSLNETFDFECFDGTKKVIRNSTVPVKNEAGVILGAIVLNEDITLLRQAQAALQLTQFSVDHAVEGFFWIGPDARILNVNEAACRMLEYTYDELMTMTLHDIDPNLSSEVWPAHWEELKQKQSMTFETKYWSRTGRVLDTEVTVNYLQYEGRECNCAIVRDIGERKRAEAALCTSEERYRSLVDNAPIGIFLNEAGRFVYANREMLRILKATSAEQLIGTPVLDRIAPESHTAVNDCIRELVLGQPVSSRDERLVALDGSQVDVVVSAIPTFLDGNPVMQVLALDITERKQLAEREISHSRQLTKLYELSMTLSGDPGVVLEHAVRIIGELFKVQVVCLSEIVGQELHFKSVCINGQTFADAGHCPLAITPCATVEQTRDVRIFDRVMERFPEASFLRDHEAVSYCGFPALDSNGRVVAVTCLLDNKPREFSKEEQDLLRMFGQRIATEIERSHHTAEQKRAEKELRESHVFIRQIIDTHPNFIFAKDREGRFTLVNKAVADVYGTTVENLIGKTDADFNSNQEEVASFCQQDLAVMDTLHELFFPDEAITGFDGRTRWLQTVKRPILDDEGRAIMVLGSSTDITERKRMEETLRQRERDLQAALQERERISQDLHDGILQSLFAVGLSLETTKSMMSPRTRKTSGSALDQAIQQLNLVMREIRNFIAGLGSDLLQGKDLTMALKQMLASLTENQVTNVRLAVDDRAAKALSTEQSLHLVRVIQEAVSNCIQHGNASEARVSLKLLKQGVRLSVRDNGCGFTLTSAQRTGHGLRNMASRAQKMGGKFSILSKVNEGTSIVLDLPKEATDAFR
jgi:PAS domain S-box-containing protein